MYLTLTAQYCLIKRYQLLNPKHTIQTCFQIRSTEALKTPQFNWSATFELPAIKGNFWDEIFGILTGEDKLNTAHVLSFKVGSKINNYLVNIGESL